jgi:hypothetical protein
VYAGPCTPVRVRRSLTPEEAVGQRTVAAPVVGGVPGRGDGPVAVALRVPAAVVVRGRLAATAEVSAGGPAGAGGCGGRAAAVVGSGAAPLVPGLVGPARLLAPGAPARGLLHPLQKTGAMAVPGRLAVLPPVTAVGAVPTGVRVDPLGRGATRLGELAVLPGARRLLLGPRGLVPGACGALGGFGLLTVGTRSADLGLVPLLGGLKALFLAPTSARACGEQSAHDEQCEHHQHDDYNLPHFHAKDYPIGLL